jgi:hypothetical protein
VTAAVECACALLILVSALNVAHAQDARSLRARHTGLQSQLASSPFGLPLLLESADNGSALKGDIYAVVEHPFGEVGKAIQNAGHWCDILILHQNVKRCGTTGPRGGETVNVAIGRKHDRPMEETYALQFRFRVLAATPDYLHAKLGAEAGPMGTSNYEIALEAVALDSRHSFLHMSYSYDYGTTARVAMRGYLATVGRNKRGFSTTGTQTDGLPAYIGGTRGVVERNTMRYYLAIEAYLSTLAAPADRQLEQRLTRWYAGVERYPLQLHELERDEYLSMKRRETRRQ